MTFDAEKESLKLMTELGYSHMRPRTVVRIKDALQRAFEAGQRASQEALREALGDARKAFQALKRLAADPMRSWETGAVVDAGRVEDIADEAIELINVTLATPREPSHGGERCGRWLAGGKGFRCAQPANHEPNGTCGGGGRG